MPGGFENSAMKTSFSLSSLQPSSVNLESPEHVRLQDRPYSSLRKKPRKDPEHESWRRSWGSREENKDEFWAALKNNYQYLMDSNLIDSCKEARRDLQYGASPTHEWSYEQFSEQFTELDTWLNSIQEAVYSKEETVIDRNLRLSHMEEMQRKAFKRKLFNNQSGRLVARMPDLKDVVAWRVLYLNRKWERLEQTVTPRKRSHTDHLDVCTAIIRSSYPRANYVEHKLRCLRKWIKETEQRLQPLNFRVVWTLQELEEKAKEHEVVRRDVWSHGKIVRSVVKLCERLAWAEGNAESISSWVRGRRYEPSQAVRFARGLERRWQLLYLTSLEWQCHIERLTNDLKHQGPGSQSGCIAESDEEPVTKYPRLCEEVITVECDTTTPVIQEDEADCLMETANVGEVAGGEMEVESSVCNTERLYCASMEADENKDRVIMIQDVPPERNIFPDETSKFNTSVRNSWNCATFYAKHIDTDTEKDQGMKNSDMKSTPESSDEEWTYTGVDQSQSDVTSMTQSLQELPEHNERLETEQLEEDMLHPVGAINPTQGTPPDSSVIETDASIMPEADTQRPMQEVIKRLVNQAEEMVREEVASPARKSRVFEPLRLIDPATNTNYTRIEEWLQLQDPDSKTVGDSCDASGEYTTEDDDIESKNEPLNDSQQDLDSTLVNTAPSTPDQPKVIMRPKRLEGSAPRPWSVSGTLTTTTTEPELSHLAHSISESAIHRLAQTPSTSTQCSGKADSSVNTLSSSTVEDTAQTQEGSGGGYSSNSLRRRKVKLRKRNLMRKSESGSEGMSPMVHSDGSHQHLASVTASPAKLPPLIKSTSRRSSADKTLNTDSPHRRYPTTVLSPSSSETDSEEDRSEGSVKPRRKVGNLPAFRIGPTYTLSAYADRRDKLVSADSSYSEQAWDNFQEKYMSEAYSEEAADSEAARKLLDFGDDYRNFLDSQSDCASSLGRPPLHRRKKAPPGGESDSDLEELWNLVGQSHSQLAYSEQVFNTQLSKASPHLVLTSDFAEISATCRENVKCLNLLLQNIEQRTALLSEQECKEIRALVDKWKGLEKGAEELQRVRSLHREMAALRAELYEIATRVATVETDIEDRDQLEFRIQEVKSESSRLRDLKTQLKHINLEVHTFIAESDHPSPAQLKDEVAELFRVWEDTNQSIRSELNSLQEVGAAFQQFESHLAGLQVALRGDQETLRVLDIALQQRGGSVSPDLASSVRDLAKVLSEKQDSPALLSQEELGAGAGTTEGSLSDSGISDSGSEQDLSERERRLAALRRLVRHLEAVLAPGSAAIVNMSKRIEQTENELRGLQQTCRDLIVRTAVCAEAKSKSEANCKTLPDHQEIEQNNNMRSRKEDGVLSGVGCDSDDGSDFGGGWLRRVLRAALPFHFAIIALYCVAYLLEPHCCDSMNNLSITPQLRYPRGPPPI